MKILDRYILISFLKTFFSVFIILMFIFVLQTIWLYISELAGKDLDVWIVLKFLWYVSPRLIPLVLPLTILVTSLMVFGNFSEKYEFAAMKSTGISLQRAMRSLTVFILLLSVTAFFFANNVIPYSEYKWQNLRRNIAQVSPSMVIVEGQFSQIGDDFNIKVEEKSGDRDQYLRNVVIHKKNPSHPNGNYTVIIADNGELSSAEGSNTLSLILNDGHYYDDVQVKDPKEQDDLPFVKSYFEQYTINIDLTEFNNMDVEKENELSNHNMYKMSELFVEIDSLSDSYTKDIRDYAANMYYRSGLAKFKDKEIKNVSTADTVSSVLEVYPKPLRRNILNNALNSTRGTLQSIATKKTEFQIKTKRLNKHEIALHEKYVLAFACIILFFVGAPLGAIIRKGGMGLPMVIAILLFLTYHFIGIFAKNSAEDGTMHPFIASWISTFIMLPLGVWLTYRATTDQGIFDIDSFMQRFKRKSDLAVEMFYEDLSRPIHISDKEQETIDSMTIRRLKNVVKNAGKKTYSKDFRTAALIKLEEEGISQEQLFNSGDLINQKVLDAYKVFKVFRRYSLFTFIMYALGLGLPMGIAFIHKNDETYSVILGLISLITLILFFVYFIRLHKALNSMRKLADNKPISRAWLLPGIPFFPLVYLYFKNLLGGSFKSIR